ncbi:hypothetical protein BVRB_8g193090 [Beta vulgaris subsp. vulgaris]|nr:hypothetical protein BVRB_8g193090 [Beta vulgaris subsp. vulgaris]
MKMKTSSATPFQVLRQLVPRIPPLMSLSTLLLLEVLPFLPWRHWIGGTCARLFKSKVQFEHAGATSGGEMESAQAKNQALREAGAVVRTLLKHLRVLSSKHLLICLKRARLQQ